MAIRRALIVFGVCLIGYSLAQNCDQALKDFGDCLKENFKKSGGPAGQGKPNFDEIKTKAEKCFTDNGCELPPKPTGPPGGFTHPPRNFTHPPGGRAGRVDNDQRRQCFGAVGNKTKDAMLQCMRKTDPSFNFPTGEHGHGGPGGEHDGHGFGGPGGPHGGPHGGPGGPGGFHGGDEILTKACQNNAQNVQKAKDCLKNLFPQQAPAGAKNGFCEAKKTCEAKLGTCKDILEKRRQAMCQCGNELQSQREEFLKAEPSCASFLQNDKKKPAGQQKPHDCTPKADPCAGQ